jgi:hypothetical protein
MHGGKRKSWQESDSGKRSRSEAAAVPSSPVLVDLSGIRTPLPGVPPGGTAFLTHSARILFRDRWWTVHRYIAAGADGQAYEMCAEAITEGGVGGAGGAGGATGGKGGEGGTTESLCIKIFQPDSRSADGELEFYTDNREILDAHDGLIDIYACGPNLGSRDGSAAEGVPLDDNKNHSFAIMELLPNGDMFNFCGVFPMHEDVVRYLAKQIVGCLVHLHHCGIVHRDLKNENVSLTKVCVVWVVFVCARARVWYVCACACAMSTSLAAH